VIKNSQPFWKKSENRRGWFFWLTLYVWSSVWCIYARPLSGVAENRL